jgi:hypothetical protein
MTHPPDPGLADSIGNGVWIFILVVLNIWTRFKQGKHLEESVDLSLQTRVSSLEKSLNATQTALKTTQELVAIYIENVKETNVLSKELKAGMVCHQKRMDEHGAQMNEFKSTLEKGETLTAQINDYLERAKSGKIQEEPPVTGTVTFKEEKRKPNG